jgi:hypothetical protein
MLSSFSRKYGDVLKTGLRVYPLPFPVIDAFSTSLH